MTFDEFVSRFSTEEQCRKYLSCLRWPDGFVCPKCSAGKRWEIGATLCECAKCGHQTSVIAGTVFQDTRRPLKTWFVAIWWITTQKYGVSAEGLRQVLGLKSYETSWTWLHKIRHAMVRPGRSKLQGKIEVDEAYIGGREKGGKRGRGSENKVSIAVAVELCGKSSLGRIRIQVIDDASSGSLKPFIKGNIEAGSTLVTDDWAGYSGIAADGYGHEITKAKNNSDALPHVHMVTSLLKRWLLGTHQGAVSKKHLQSYLDEYVFRFNRRKSAKRGLLFYRLLECAMNIEPITLDQLIHKDDA